MNTLMSRASIVAKPTGEERDKRLETIAKWNNAQLCTMRAEFAADLMTDKTELTEEVIPKLVQLIAALDAPKLRRLAFRVLATESQLCAELIGADDKVGDEAARSDVLQGEQDALEHAYRRLISTDSKLLKDDIIKMCKVMEHEEELDMIVLLLDALTGKSIESDPPESASSVAVSALQSAAMVQRLAEAQNRARVFLEKEDANDAEPDGSDESDE